MDSTPNLDTIIQGSGSQDLQANALFDAGSPATLYGRRASTTSGTTWGYYGGNVTKSDGTQTTISSSTLALATSSTNYIVAQKSDGVVSFSSATTNWHDTRAPPQSIANGQTNLTLPTPQQVTRDLVHHLPPMAKTQTTPFATVRFFRYQCLGNSSTDCQSRHACDTGV